MFQGGATPPSPLDSQGTFEHIIIIWILDFNNNCVSITCSIYLRKIGLISHFPFFIFHSSSIPFQWPQLWSRISHFKVVFCFESLRKEKAIENQANGIQKEAMAWRRIVEYSQILIWWRKLRYDRGNVQRFREGRQSLMLLHILDQEAGVRV